MGRTPWAMYLWPGLSQLWKQGDWSALGLAVGFGALLNLALAGTLVWTELLAPGTRRLTWAAVGIVWIGSAILTQVWDRQDARRRRAEPAGDAYPEALDHYLKGNWFEAERLLANLLRRNPRDLDARLMLATLLRHTRRTEEAAQQLETMERFEGSEKWALEIARERQWLQAARSEAANTAIETEDTPS